MASLFSIFLTYFWAFIVLVKTAVRILKIGREKYFYIKIRENAPACLSDPSLGRHGYLNLKGAKIHYVVNGDEQNPVMVLLHGFPDFWYTWKYQLKEFSKKYCVVAIDLRGYGESEKKPNLEDYLIPNMVEDIHQVIKHFAKDSGSAVVISHDWGGFISYYLAAKYPEAVSKLIVANAPHPNAFKSAIQSSWKQLLMSWYTFYFQIPNLPEITLKSEDLIFFNNIHTKGKKNILSEEEIDAYKYTFSKPGAMTHAVNYYRANLGRTVSKNSSTDSLRVRTPMMLLWGDKDIALSLYSATQTALHVDNLQMRVLKGATHWCQLDAPEEFNKRVWEFLSKND